jgi:phage-related protein
MIRHYQAESSNWTKPESWRALARISVAEWQHRLDQAVAS